MIPDDRLAYSFVRGHILLTLPGSNGTYVVLQQTTDIRYYPLTQHTLEPPTQQQQTSRPPRMKKETLEQKVHHG